MGLQKDGNPIVGTRYLIYSYIITSTIVNLQIRRAAFRMHGFFVY